MTPLNVTVKIMRILESCYGFWGNILRCLHASKILALWRLPIYIILHIIYITNIYYFGDIVYEICEYVWLLLLFVSTDLTGCYSFRLFYFIYIYI